MLHEVEEKIPKMKEAVSKYNETVKPLEECLTEADNVLAEVKPFGLDVNKGKEQIDKLKVILCLHINELYFYRDPSYRRKSDFVLSH